MIVQNAGVFEICGNAEWRGLIICLGGAQISLKGGGVTASHVYGAVMMGNATLEVNGTADIRYSSVALGIANRLIDFEVLSWCGDWGKHLGRFQ